MSRFRKAGLAIALAVATGLPGLATATVPLPTGPGPSAERTASPIVPIRYVCDAYGCYDRPDYRPPGYYRPPPPPPGYYRPPPPPPGYYRPAPPRGGWSRHVRWCLDRYGSYDPRSNLFVDRFGRERVCRSPFR